MRKILMMGVIAIILSTLPAIFLVGCGSGGSGGGGSNSNTNSGNDNNDSNEITKKYHDVQIANIVIDGNRDDWANIAPAVTDVSGDDLSSYTGADVKGLYIAQSTDLSKVYVMMDFWDGVSNTDLASSATSDGDATHPNVHQAYQVFFDSCVSGSSPWPCIGIGGMYDSDNNKWIMQVGSALTGTYVETYPDYPISGAEVLEFEIPIGILKSSIEAEDFKGSVLTSAYGNRREDINETSNSNQLLVVRFNK